MKQNLFEVAVKHNETLAFFKSQGRYCVRDPDWGEPLPAVHMMAMKSYAECSDEHTATVKNCFIAYIQQCDFSSDSFRFIFAYVRRLARFKKQNVNAFNSYLEQGDELSQAILLYLIGFSRTEIDEQKSKAIMHWARLLREEDHTLIVTELEALLSKALND